MLDGRQHVGRNVVYHRLTDQIIRTEKADERISSGLISLRVYTSRFRVDASASSSYTQNRSEYIHCSIKLTVNSTFVFECAQA